MSECNNYECITSRRSFLSKAAYGLGAISLASFFNPALLANVVSRTDRKLGKGALGFPHFAPKAKRVIYMFQSGAPSQLDLFDYKPLLNEMNGDELPESVRQGQRLTGMTAGQTSFPLAGSQFSFQKWGESGSWMSDLIPYQSKIVDELCFIKSMYTEAINHDPAATFIQTGSQFPGRPAIGSWIDYGLGSDNENLPSFVVLLTKNRGGQETITP